MNKNVQAFTAFALTGIAVYLLATQSGQGVSSTIATGIENMLTPRGIRNNNPGNIRHSTTTWQGQAAQQTDPSFVQFDTPEAGIRAISHILASYANRGITTVQDIINTWAPPSENDTQAYIDAVTGQMGVAPNEQVTATNKADLIAAIIQHENGQQPYNIDQIDTGIAMV